MSIQSNHYKCNICLFRIFILIVFYKSISPRQSGHLQTAPSPQADPEALLRASSCTRSSVTVWAWIPLSSGAPSPHSGPDPVKSSCHSQVRIQRASTGKAENQNGPCRGSLHHPPWEVGVLLPCRQGLSFCDWSPNGVALGPSLWFLSHIIEVRRPAFQAAGQLHASLGALAAQCSPLPGCASWFKLTAELQSSHLHPRQQMKEGRRTPQKPLTR